MTNIAVAVATTFPDNSWDIYAKKMLESFVANWPHEVPILVQTDTAELAEQINGIIRPHDGLKSGMEAEHAAFVERNKDKDHAYDYRKQAVRFSHKVFALKYALDSVNQARAANADDVPRYLIWLDADVITTRKVSLEEIEKCLPQDGRAVSYMGRKDWDHSECGWLAFDLLNGGDKLIEDMYTAYRLDNIFSLDQWHDSFVFDKTVKTYEYKTTNLTPNAVGMEVWPQSPMGAWSKHYKGPVAKSELADVKPPKQKGGMQPLKIQTRNSVPNEAIQKSVMENQAQIKNWILPCEPNDEEAVVVSAGPMFVAEDLLEEVKSGRKIFAVKHVLQQLEDAGITPFGCILLDPRPHMCEFVKNPNKNIIWFVASQVDPSAVKTLLDAGCEVWGYHASVGAGEAKYTDKQPHSIIDGGSATATRGLFLLDRLGFKKFRLYGYDLCLPKKPDLSERDEEGQPKNFEIEVGYQMPFFKDARWFWSKGELLAQADEFRQILELNKWDIQAFGHGIVPFLANIRKVNDLRKAAKLGKMKLQKPAHYEEMLGCNKDKARFSMPWRKMLPRTLRKQTKASN